MPDFLLELFCEEIPSSMQESASHDLQRLVIEGLSDAGLKSNASVLCSTACRLTLGLSGVPEKAEDRFVERRGPRVDAPSKAISGFLESAALSAIDQAEIVRDGKKGDFYVARREESGRQAVDILSALIPDLLDSFPWKKSMRWGSGSLRWVRPLRSILCLFGHSGSKMRVVPFEIEAIASSNITYGHRFMAPAVPIEVTYFNHYFVQLKEAYVILDPAVRRETISREARKLASAQGFELVEDEGLLQEVSGLVEWPVVLMGRFSSDFLTVPPEVIRTTIRAKQKCFVLRDPVLGTLAPFFILVSNIFPRDGGAEVIKGHERVIAARLSDACFFYEQDMKIALESRNEQLRAVVFHERLGTQYERVERIATRVRSIAARISADLGMASRAAWLSKADLVTEMVGEFPELQGVMGRCYAEAQGEAHSVARAIEDHYRPRGPRDPVPDEPISIALALADKLDMLTAFWSIGETPTGRKDPYGLRRAALGVIRMILDRELDLPLLPEIDGNKDLLSFFLDRLKVHLREQGFRHDLIDAAFMPQGHSDLLVILRRVKALDEFVNTGEGCAFLASLKRVGNILRAAEKQDNSSFGSLLDFVGLELQAEQDLFRHLDRISPDLDTHIARSDFVPAMVMLASLSPLIDVFFEGVVVNVNDMALRETRLKLLARVRSVSLKVADFFRIEG
ncbi:MAG: glycine--tRNA ligase subunit beta [Alphaproteobacteria bacterium]|nr:glycine--tRNA ligase subunit beta [Alphaproteobacteria bacterium]